MTKSTITREQITAWMNDANYALEEPLNADDAAAARAILAMGDELLAAMDSEPVAYTDEEELNFVNDMACMWTKGMGINEVPLYRHAQPAPVVPTFDEWLELRGNKPLGWVKDAMRESYDACRAAMLQAEPVTTANKLPELIEGMEVSIDVSTCDADAGNRYFGTVAELSELDGAKNGYILLVQDAKPNFNQSSNSPVIPDGSEHCPCCGKKLRRACSVEGCGGKHVAHGLCKKHYDMKRWEDPEQVRKFREAGKRYRRKTKSAAAAPQEVSHD